MGPTHMGHDNCIRAGRLWRQRLRPPRQQLQLVADARRLCCPPRIGVHSAVDVHAHYAVHIRCIQLQVGPRPHACRGNATVPLHQLAVVLLLRAAAWVVVRRQHSPTSTTVPTPSSRCRHLNSRSFTSRNLHSALGLQHAWAS